MGGIETLEGRSFGMPLLSFEGIGPVRSKFSRARSLKSLNGTGQGPCGPRTPPRWAYSSVGLEHTPDKREVGSSNLPRPTNQGVGWKDLLPRHSRGAVAQLGERRFCKP